VITIQLQKVHSEKRRNNNENYCISQSAKMLKLNATQQVLVAYLLVLLGLILLREYVLALLSSFASKPKEAGVIVEK
jgi:hypothetical protein